MTCEATRETMCEYLDGLLEGDRECQFKQHLADCADCRQEAEELRNTLSWVKQASDVNPPSGLRQAVLKQLAQEKQTRRFAPGFSQAVAAAAVFLVLVMGNMVPAQLAVTDKAPAVLEDYIKQAPDMEGTQEVAINTLESPTEMNRSGSIDDSAETRSNRNYRLLLNATLAPVFLLLSFLAVKKRREARP